MNGSAAFLPESGRAKDEKHLTRSVHELRMPVQRAVMLSMSFTGTKGLVFEHTRGEMVAGEFYSHDDYDEAMAALDELCRRAKKGEA